MNGVFKNVLDRVGSSVMMFQCFRSVFFILFVVEYVVRKTRGRGCLGVEGLLVVSGSSFRSGVVVRGCGCGCGWRRSCGWSGCGWRRSGCGWGGDGGKSFLDKVVWVSSMVEVFGEV